MFHFKIFKIITILGKEVKYKWQRKSARLSLEIKSNDVNFIG